MKKFWLGSFLLFFATSAQAALVSQTLEYQDGEAVLEGYLVYDDAVQGNRPGVIVVHEWKGLNDYAKGRADQLAKLGYVGFAIDMYGKEVRPKTHEEAAQASGIYRSDRNLMRTRAKAAYDFLNTQSPVDSAKIAAIGYCFGGTTVLEMARAGMDLKGVASFHGSLDSPLPAGPGAAKAKIVVYHGEEDSFIKPEAIEAFKNEMRESGADWQFISFGGAVHSFTVPAAGNDKSTGMAYDEKADKRSWVMLENFLQEVFFA